MQESKRLKVQLGGWPAVVPGLSIVDRQNRLPGRWVGFGDHGLCSPHGSETAVGSQNRARVARGYSGSACLAGTKIAIVPRGTIWPGWKSLKIQCPGLFWIDRPMGAQAHGRPRGITNLNGTPESATLLPNTLPAELFHVEQFRNQHSPAALQSAVDFHSPLRATWAIRQTNFAVFTQPDIAPARVTHNLPRHLLAAESALSVSSCRELHSFSSENFPVPRLRHCPGRPRGLSF